MSSPSLPSVPEPPTVMSEETLTSTNLTSTQQTFKNKGGKGRKKPLVPSNLTISTRSVQTAKNPSTTEVTTASEHKAVTAPPNEVSVVNSGSLAKTSASSTQPVGYTAAPIKASSWTVGLRKDTPSAVSAPLNSQSCLKWVNSAPVSMATPRSRPVSVSVAKNRAVRREYTKSAQSLGSCTNRIKSEAKIFCGVRKGGRNKAQSITLQPQSATGKRVAEAATVVENKVCRPQTEDELGSVCCFWSRTLHLLRHST